MRLQTIFFLAVAFHAALGGVSASAAPAATSSVVKTDQVRAELVAHAPQGVQAGQPLWLGLRIEHQPHWHTYWKNPGDSGLATTLSWTLPAGFSVGDIEWPTPRQLPVGPLMNFGYEGTLLLPVRVTVPSGFNQTGLQVKLEAQWLVCKEVCIPEGGQFVLDLPARAATAGWADAFSAAWAAQPQALSAAQASARVQGSTLELEVAGLPEAWRGRALKWFPETAGVLDNASPGTARWTPQGLWQAQLNVSAQRTESPTQLPLVLVADNQSAGLRIQATMAGPWPTPSEQPAPAATLQTPSVAPDASAAAMTSALPLTLCLALLGGVLLNLMPCVFPVLSLKVISFTTQAQDRRQLVWGGLAYTVGVVTSFLALAAVLLAMRAAGEQLGWGFQLQSPTVVAGLAALFAVMGLNLAGVFEWGSLLPASWAGLRVRNTLLDSALTGVLAVAVASPCTAPFMGASIGLALTWPAPAALAVFAALGLGMALPYLLACAWPGLARWMPKPGSWMVVFKQFMAFPMWATVVWLLWVLGQQAGVDAMVALLGLLWAIGVATWVIGSGHLGPRSRRWWALACVALLTGTWIWAAPSFREPGTPVASAPSWQAWSPERVSQALNAGQPVFIDFTAAWCVTCQFNKRTVLSDAQVLADFTAKRVLLLRADWTRRDPAISAELARLRRSGVPVYVLQAPGGASAQLLNEVLTVPEVRAAIASLP
jgi:thiol:disulfide interchange protein DsbD